MNVFWAQTPDGAWHLTSEGARKAWETRRANGEGRQESTPAAERAPRAPSVPAVWTKRGEDYELERDGRVVGRLYKGWFRNGGNGWTHDGLTGHPTIADAAKAFDRAQRTTAVTPERKRAVATDIRSSLRGIASSSGSYIGRDDIEDVRQTANGAEFGIRHFGSWENPPDVSDEDGEDYDWQVPTAATAAKLADIARKAERDNPGVSVTYSVEEKNWIMFYVESKR